MIIHIQLDWVTRGRDSEGEEEGFTEVRIGITSEKKEDNTKTKKRGEEEEKIGVGIRKESKQIV